jgi:hypothetical protein
MSQRPSRGLYNGPEFEDEVEFEDDKLPTMVGGGVGAAVPRSRRFVKANPI